MEKVDRSLHIRRFSNVVPGTSFRSRLDCDKRTRRRSRGVCQKMRSSLLASYVIWIGSS